MQVIDVNLHVPLWLSLVSGKQSEALGCISNTGNDSAYMRLAERSLQDKDNHLREVSVKAHKTQSPSSRQASNQSPAQFIFIKMKWKIFVHL